MSDTAIQRQIALDVYPQREDAKPGWLERFGEKLFTSPVKLFTDNRLILRAILPLVRREARRLEGLAESDLVAEAIHLRYELRRKGFERSLVAKSFALVREISRQKLGMAHYEIRKYPGWHHHMLMTILAHFFLWRLKVRWGKKSTGTYGIAAAHVT